MLPFILTKTLLSSISRACTLNYISSRSIYVPFQDPPWDPQPAGRGGSVYWGDKCSPLKYLTLIPAHGMDTFLGWGSSTL